MSTDLSLLAVKVDSSTKEARGINTNILFERMVFIVSTVVKYLHCLENLHAWEKKNSPRCTVRAASSHVGYTSNGGDGKAGGIMLSKIQANLLDPQI